MRQSLHYRRLPRLIYRRCVRECIDINQWYSNSLIQSYFSRTDRRYRFSMIHEIRTRSSMTSCFADSEAEQEFFSTNRRLGIYNLCHLRECNDKRIFSRLTECNSNTEFRNTSRLWVSTSPDEGRRISNVTSDLIRWESWWSQKFRYLPIFVNSVRSTRASSSKDYWLYCFWFHPLLTSLTRPSEWESSHCRYRFTSRRQF